MFNQSHPTISWPASFVIIADSVVVSRIRSGRNVYVALDKITSFIGIECANDQHNGSTSEWSVESPLQNLGTARSCWAFEEAQPFRLHVANQG